jgi:hypothetical protein
VIHQLEKLWLYEEQVSYPVLFDLGQRVGRIEMVTQYDTPTRHQRHVDENL